MRCRLASASKTGHEGGHVSRVSPNLIVPDGEKMRFILTFGLTENAHRRHDAAKNGRRDQRESGSVVRVFDKQREKFCFWCLERQRASPEFHILWGETKRLKTFLQPRLLPARSIGAWHSGACR